MGRMSDQYRVQNPATNEVVETFDFITDAELSSALDRADEAFTQWREVSFDDRAKLLCEIASLFDAKRPELTRIIAEEMGKPLNQGEGELDDVVGIFNYYAKHGAALSADEPIEHTGGEAVIRKVPIGVIVGVMPWTLSLIHI